MNSFGLTVVGSHRERNSFLKLLVRRYVESPLSVAQRYATLRRFPPLASIGPAGRRLLPSNHSVPSLGGNGCILFSF